MLNVYLILPTVEYSFCPTLLVFREVLKLLKLIKYLIVPGIYIIYWCIHWCDKMMNPTIDLIWYDMMMKLPIDS